MAYKAVYLLKIQQIYSAKIPVSFRAHCIQIQFSSINSVFFSGSMSLQTLIPALEDKFYALHNGSFDSETDTGRNESTSPLSPSILRGHQLISLQPLTIGDDSIPYADDSPDQPTMPSSIGDKSIENGSPNHPYTTFNSRIKQWNPTTSNNNYTNRLKTYRNQDTIDAKSKNSISSDDNDTDESNTSDNERDNQTIRINSDVIREMNRILTTLERKATKLNRSLSLNIKYHHNECCCNNGHGHVISNSNHSSCRSIALNRYSLTKDEKTDKNINLAKKRQIQDNNPRNKRYTNRPIKRRHTVGGIHYGYNNKINSVDTTQTR